MMKRLLAILVVMAMVVGALIPVLAQTSAASACENGLTPGYWKNHTEVWDNDPLGEWDGPVPGDSFEDVFGVDIPGADVTLLQALQTGGGQWKALNRHAVAALLNSYWLGAESDGWDYYSEYHIIVEVVQEAYDSGNFEFWKNHLEEAYDWA